MYDAVAFELQPKPEDCGLEVSTRGVIISNWEPSEAEDT
jgi:hypothetical protein